MNINRIILTILIAVLALQASAKNQTENVVLVTIDGVRTEEVFDGFNTELFSFMDKNATKKAAFAKYSAQTSALRRERLMPFVWKELLLKYGSIAGNAALGSKMETTNNMLFSFPGYSEILTGEAHDDVIYSNNRVQNPYPSVLQFLQKKMRLNSNQVAAFGSWDAINEVVSSDPDAFVINAGYKRYANPDNKITYFSDTQFLTPTEWDNVRHDFYTFNLAMAHLKKYKPRVLYISLGETDDWAHGEHYDKMADALNRNDAQLRELWNFLRHDAQYKNKTTLVVTVDHGRGSSYKTWSDHGKDVPEARNIWAIFASPDSSLRGEWKNAPTIYQNQIAATLANLLGFDYSEQNSRAGKPINLTGN
ncbi:MAG: alkaline phosphatase family protein [Pyrinomonadaceae bacterium]